METETRTSLVLDLADVMTGLPPAIAGGLGISSGGAPRQTRRLPERILVAAHQACDIGDLDVAAQLLSILETVISQSRGAPDPARRRVMESLIAAHQRLWHLRRAAGDRPGQGAERPGLIATKTLPGFHEEVEGFGGF